MCLPSCVFLCDPGTWGVGINRALAARCFVMAYHAGSLAAVCDRVWVDELAYKLGPRALPHRPALDVTPRACTACVGPDGLSLAARVSAVDADDAEKPFLRFAWPLVRIDDSALQARTYREGYDASPIAAAIQSLLSHDETLAAAASADEVLTLLVGSGSLSLVITGPSAKVRALRDLCSAHLRRSKRTSAEDAAVFGTPDVSPASASPVQHRGVADRISALAASVERTVTGTPTLLRARPQAVARDADLIATSPVGGGGTSRRQRAPTTDLEATLRTALPRAAMLATGEEGEWRSTSLDSQATW